MTMIEGKGRSRVGIGVELETIAGTAGRCGCSLATPNTSDFRDLGLSVLETR